MLAFQAGDDSAFEVLVREYEGPAFAMLRRLLGPNAPIEDLAQEAFVRVWRSRQRYRPDGRFTTYLYRITYHLALNQIRDSRRRPWTSMGGSPGGEPQAEAAPEGMLGRAGGKADGAVWAARIARALGALPENQRAALVFQHYDGLDLAEIGQILGASPQAVKSLLHRARERMRAMLETDWNSEQ
jgi:RNA polymerase sigma-70 factor (ECF subfamily)